PQCKWNFVLMQTNQLPEVSYREEGEHMPHVSFARDIRPLCRAVDISHMKSHGIKLDDHTFMSNPDNANKVLRALSPHDGHPPSMPPGGALLDRGSARVVRPVAEGRIPAVSLIMATQEIPLVAFHPHARIKRFPSPRGASTIKIDRPSGQP